MFVRVASGQPMYSSRPPMRQAALTAARQVQSDSGSCMAPWRPALMQPLCISTSLVKFRLNGIGFEPSTWLCSGPPWILRPGKLWKSSPCALLKLRSHRSPCWPWKVRAPQVRCLCRRPLRPLVFPRRQNLRELPNRLLPSIRRTPLPVRQSRDVPPKDLIRTGNPRGRASGSPSVKELEIGTAGTGVAKP